MEEIYKDCMRNHAATLGTYATDGCGEYTPDAANRETMRCAACGCHRNFHRKVTPTPSTTDIGFGGNTVVTGYMPTSEDDRHFYNKKRTRTKFSVEQKERMMGFAEKIGWKMPRKAAGGEEMERLCREIGVSRQVFKVWMHNHKNESSSSGGGGGGKVGEGSGGQPDSSTLGVESSPSYG